MAHPFPELAMQPLSGLSFPWAEYHPEPATGSFSASLGSDGVTLGMKMLIFWKDLQVACQELLGYSYRDDVNLTPAGGPTLRRKLPWQHPYWNQLYVKRIADVRGIRMQGKNFDAEGIIFEIFGGGIGPGYQPNLGPWTDYFLAELTVQFWRPPYFLRSDEDILDLAGNPREWLRYVSKTWEMSLSVLSRENSTFVWLPALQPQLAPAPFNGSVGQVLSHFKMSRTWYQIPERALFNSLVDATPNGLPDNIVYTRTPTENPFSKFDRAAGTSTTIPSPAALVSRAGYTYPVRSPIGGCVNAPIGGLAVDSAGNWIDATTASRFFGCYSGTLRFDGVTFTPQPLQLPAYLMRIPLFGAGNEALAQQQYDVTFLFDLFDPPPGSTLRDAVSAPNNEAPLRGHNLFPFSGNGLWYPLLSQKDENNQPNTTAPLSGPKLTPFMYADFTDLFRIL